MELYIQSSVEECILYQVWHLAGPMSMSVCPPAPQAHYVHELAINFDWIQCNLNDMVQFSYIAMLVRPPRNQPVSSSGLCLKPECIRDESCIRRTGHRELQAEPEAAMCVASLICVPFHSVNHTLLIMFIKRSKQPLYTPALPAAWARSECIICGTWSCRAWHAGGP